MSKEEYFYLYNQSNQDLWEKSTNNSCTISDLDKNRIKEVIRTAVIEKRMPESALSESIPTILKKLNLINNNKLTNAAVILFCKKEDLQFMQSNIRLARFKGIDKSEFLDNKTFRANAFDLYDKAMDFLHFTLPVAARIEEGKAERVETPTIPYKVLREAIVNALAHRDYSHPGGSVFIAVYDDRVNISNIGALPKGLELKQLPKEHPSIPRNPLIARVFYLCKKIEGWGRGTIDMIENCKKAGNPIPKYEEIGNSFSVTLPLKEPLRVVKKEQKYLNKLTERQQKIIQALQDGPMTRQQIMDSMNTSLSGRTMQFELAKLKKVGLIKSEGTGKFITWYLIH